MYVCDSICCYIAQPEPKCGFKNYLRHANYIAHCMAFTKTPNHLKLAVSSVRFKIGSRI